MPHSFIGCLAVAAGWLLAAGLSAFAQPIPERPEDLRFDRSSFEAPSIDGMRYELSNGLPVYVVVDRRLPLVDVVLALPVGDRHEASGEDGLASMTAVNARRGGAGSLDADALDDEIDALGARIQSASSWTRTVVALDVRADGLDRGLELMASIVFEPRFDERRLGQLRANLMLRLAAEADDPRTVLEAEWLSLVHGPDAARSRRLTEEMVARFDREALAAFHGRHWGPDGAVLAVSGDVAPDAVVARLEEIFGAWRQVAGEASTASAFASLRRTPPPPAGVGESAAVAASSPGWWILERPGSQAAVAIGHRGAVFDRWDDRDRWAMILLVEILDGPGAVSRLRSELQLERGLTYRVVTHFDLQVRSSDEEPGGAADGHAGEFRVFLETAPEHVAEAVSVVLDELERLQRAAVGAAELETAKTSVLARFPLLFDGADTVAGRFAEDELVGRPYDYWAVYRERILAVTAADIRRAARLHVDPAGVTVLVVGERARIEAGRDASAVADKIGSPQRLRVSRDRG